MRLYDLDPCKFILFIILFIHSATVNIYDFVISAYISIRAATQSLSVFSLPQKP